MMRNDTTSLIHASAGDADALMKKMTIAEKVAQLRSMPLERLCVDGRLSRKRMEKALVDGIGWMPLFSIERTKREAGRVAPLSEQAKNIRDAILLAWYPGEEGGNALADILFGKVSPSGRLPVTLPASTGQSPIYYAKHGGAMDVMLGNYYMYTTYFKQLTKPAFPFGFGLTYSEVYYNDLTLSSDTLSTDGTLTLSFTMQNDGEYDVQEVVQVYVRDRCASVCRPQKELKAFAKVPLAKGSAKRVHVTLHAEHFSFHGRDGLRAIEPGEHDVMVARSAEDTRLAASFTIEGELRYVRERTTYFADARYEDA